MGTGPKKIENRGGKREGAGRKPETLSASQVAEMLRIAKKYAVKYKKTMDEILLDIIYDPDVGRRDQLACIKLWKEYTIAKVQEGGETDRSLAEEGGPQIGLPERQPDPAKVTKLKQKKA